VTTATIKLFLLHGDVKRLRTAEISSWTGKAVAAPRTEFDELLGRPELSQPGVYILTGNDPETGKLMAYIGEAEVIKDRLKAHTDKDFWIQALVFVSKDQHLTKGHTRYLEGRLIDLAGETGRAQLVNSKASEARLPESDSADMEAFLSRVRQLLPVLGSELLTPFKKQPSVEDAGRGEEIVLHHTFKGLHAKGMRIPSGFVVFEGSQAVGSQRDSTARQHPYIVELRAKLLEDGSLTREGVCLAFTKDVEFSSPSAAAGVLQGGGANGLISWKDKSGRTLKEIESA
jgi:hypothetical protein